MKKNIIIKLPNGMDVSLDELQNDVNASKRFFNSDQYCFTAYTVQGLIDKINELSNSNTQKIVALATDIENFKKKYPELNQDILDKCII